MFCKSALPAKPEIGRLAQSAIPLFLKNVSLFYPSVYPAILSNLSHPSRISSPRFCTAVVQITNHRFTIHRTVDLPAR